MTARATAIMTMTAAIRHPLRVTTDTRSAGDVHVVASSFVTSSDGNVVSVF